MALICPRCQCSNFQDAKQCYRCAAPLDAQRGDQPAGWSPPAQDSFQRGTASFGRDWRMASDAAPAPDRADAFLAQHFPEGARKTDTRHLLLHPLTSSPAGLLAIMLACGVALGALWPTPKSSKRAASAPQAAQQTTQPTTDAQASEERDIFEENERDRRRRERRARRTTYHKPSARSAFRPSSR